MRLGRTISVFGAALGTFVLVAQARAQFGVPITAPAPLNTNAASDSAWDAYPQVTTDGLGNWVAVWFSYDELGGPTGTDHDILVARSADNGVTWTPPAPLNTNAGADSGSDEYPQGTTDGIGNWVAVWHSNDTLGGTIGSDPDILVARSTDSGATWSAPVALNTNAGTDAGWDVSPQVTTDGLGNWLAVWMSADSLLGTIGADWDILAARSTDNGVTWTAPVALNANAGSDVGADQLAQVATDGLGNWLAVWESDDDLGGSIGSDTDILVARSADSGATWTAPVALSDNDSRWDLDPQITTDGLGNWVAVWGSDDDLGGTIGTDTDILVARSADNGATWTPATPLNANAGSDSSSDYYAQVSTDRLGNWVAAWNTTDRGGTLGEDPDILVSRSASNGATWTAPVPLNTNAGSDSGRDFRPQIATDGLGNWVAVWYLYDSLSGTVGADADILTARFQIVDCNDNGIPDDYDITSGTSQDADGDGIPDECEPLVDLQPVVVQTPNSSEAAPALPSSDPAVACNQPFYVELWASNINPPLNGLVAAYAYVYFDAAMMACGPITFGSGFPELQFGTCSPGLVYELGGATFPPGVGVIPEWVMVARVEMTPSATSGTTSISLGGAGLGVALAGGVGVPPERTVFGERAFDIVPICPYDHTGDGYVNAADFGLFVPCFPTWDAGARPECALFDYDCDSVVNATDFSLFTTAWLKPCDDPSIVIDPCRAEVACASGASIASMAPESAGGPAVVEVEPVFVAAPTGEHATELPVGITTASPDQEIFCEIWARIDASAGADGLAGVYSDVAFTPAVALVEGIDDGSIFTTLASGDLQNGFIDELGGLTVATGHGVAPDWALVARVTVRTPAAGAGTMQVLLSEAVSGIGACGVVVPPGAVRYGSAEIAVGAQPVPVLSGAASATMALLLALMGASYARRRRVATA